MVQPVPKLVARSQSAAFGGASLSVSKAELIQKSLARIKKHDMNTSPRSGWF
jgi:hypothetical protein